MSQNSYLIEYAKTGRSSCKEAACKKTAEKGIAAGELRIGRESPNHFSDGDMKTDWFHPKCWFLTQARMKAGSKKIESSDDLQGYDKLKGADKALIDDLIAGKAPKGGAKKAKAAGKKRKADSDDDEESDDEPKKKKKKAAPKKKKAKGSDDDDDDDDDEEEKKPKKKAAPKKKAKKSGDSDDDGGSDDDKPKKKKAGGGGGGGGGGVQYYEHDTKFWEVSVDGDDLTVRWGPIGANGQTKTKSYANAAAAQKEMDKLIREKTKKGYALS